MTDLDQRLKAFEAKYAVDEGMKFRLASRRNKLMGLYIGEKLGKTGIELEVYAKTVVASDMKVAGDSDVIEKIMKDLQDAKVSMTETEVDAKLKSFTNVAKEQLAIED